MIFANFLAFFSFVVKDGFLLPFLVSSDLLITLTSFFLRLVILANDRLNSDIDLILLLSNMRLPPKKSMIFMKTKNLFLFFYKKLMMELFNNGL